MVGPRTATQVKNMKQILELAMDVSNYRHGAARRNGDSYDIRTFLQILSRKFSDFVHVSRT